MHHMEMSNMNTSSQNLEQNADTSQPSYKLSKSKTDGHFSVAFRLESWLKANKVKSHLDPRKNSETFLDPKGVLRYNDTWLQVDNEANLEAQNRNSRHNTGCVQVSLNFVPGSKQVRSANKLDTNYVRFLADWQLLWNYLQFDTVDELATHASLLRIYIEFFFHKRIAQFVIFLYIYNLCVLVGVNENFKVDSVGTVSIQAFISLIEMVIYLALRVLYKGSMLGSDHTISNIQSEESLQEALRAREKEEKKEKPREYLHTVHFSSVMKKLCRKSCTEILSFININNIILPTSQHTLSYYNLLNISLKFLVRHNGMTIQDTNFNRWSYRLCLLFVLFGLPIYNVYFVYGPLWALCKDRGSDDCTFVKWYLALTAGGVTQYLLHYIFCASVVVSLVGLAYGAEIAYRLTDSWIIRFSGLRRLPSPEKIESEFANGEEQEEQQSTDPNSNENNNINSGGGNGAEECRESENPLHGGAKNETSSSTAQDSVAAGATSSPSLEPKVVGSDRKMTRELLNVVPYLSRDACEHYLFIREYMNQAGRIWSIALVGVFGIFIFIVVAYLYAVLILRSFTSKFLKVEYVCYIVIRFFILVIFPIASLAHANSFVYALLENFTVSSPEDFAILGGRDVWINFLTSAPAVWSVFGLWVTWDKFFGFAWALLSTGAAIVITLVSGTSIGDE